MSLNSFDILMLDTGIITVIPLEHIAIKHTKSHTSQAKEHFVVNLYLFIHYLKN